MQTAAVYLRVSTEDQTEYSPDAQLREMRQYADEHGIRIDERYIFSDEGISGRSAQKRQGFQEMIRTARRPDHPFSLILVHKFDRFARSREDSVVYKALLRRCGVTVVSVKEPISDGSYAGVMEAIYESFAEAYSINLSQEVKKGMTEKALRGQLQTAPPYGYRAKDHCLVPDPEEAPWIRYLFTGFAEGKSCFTLAGELNAAGQHTHRGNPFEGRTVEYILRNPVYIGYLRWNPSGKLGRGKESENRIVVQGSHTPLVDPALWKKVRARLLEKKDRSAPHARPSSGRKHWLSGILRCADCGAALIWTKPGYFRCGRYLRGGCGASQHIPAKAVQEAVLSVLAQRFSGLTPPDYHLCGKPNGSSQLIRQRLDRLNMRQNRIREGYLSGLFDENQAKALLQQVKAEQEALCAASETDGSGRAPGREPDIAAEIRTVCSGELPKGLSIERLHNAVSASVSEILVSRKDGKLTIYYRDLLRGIR